MAVRVSELPVVTSLNDDDYIIINTQNIVTQGIEAEFFIESLFGRDLQFTGTPVFSGGATFNGDVTLNYETVLNDNITINGDLTLNGSTSIKIGDLADVDTTGAIASSILSYNAGAGTWVAVDLSAGGGGSGNPAGNNKTIQFNDGGSFGGATNLLLDTTSSGSPGLIVKGNNGNIELTNLTNGGLINATNQLSVSSVGKMTLTTTDFVFSDRNDNRVVINNFGNGIKGDTTLTDNLEVQGTIKVSGINYPSLDGAAGQVITTDGNGNLSFTTNSASGGIALTDLTVNEVAPAAQAKLEYDNTTGDFTFTPNTVVSGGATIPFQATAPTTTTAGDLWINSTTYKLYVWDGSWIATS